MKKITSRIPNCMKPDDAEAARCCVAPLMVLAVILVLAAFLGLTPGCSTIAEGSRGFADDAEAAERGLAEFFSSNEK